MPVARTTDINATPGTAVGTATHEGLQQQQSPVRTLDHVATGSASRSQEALDRFG